MAATLRIEVAQEEDLPRLMELFLPAFEHTKYMQLVGDTNTTENRVAAAARHLHTWKEHAEVSNVPLCIKCIYTDLTTRQETIISTAYWAIYDRPRAEHQYTKPVYLFRGEWVEDEAKREEAQQWAQPAANRTAKWFGSKPHGELSLMCTDPAWERKGAATMCIQWGLDRCAERKIPAWLTASPAGKPLYERMGFEVAEESNRAAGRGVPMIWWPEGTAEKDKKPVLPDWGK